MEAPPIAPPALSLSTIAHLLTADTEEAGEARETLVESLAEHLEIDEDRLRLTEHVALDTAQGVSDADGEEHTTAAARLTLSIRREGAGELREISALLANSSPSALTLTLTLILILNLTLALTRTHTAHPAPLTSHP